jgi:REP element-mobilizing transposase RayT
VPRSIRLEYPGAFYHVMARGNRRERIFADDVDHRFFLGVLAETAGMTGWRVHGWVLMRNHYHLMLETPEPNLVAGMKWLQNTYTRRFNTRHRLWGRLFGDRYKAVNVEGRAGDFYGTLLDYIHLNPVRAGIIAPHRDESVRDYPWSSVAGGYALPARQRAGWLAAADGLAAFGLADDTRGRRAFVERLDRRAREEAQERCGVPALPDDARRSHLRHGWYWGTQAFAEKLLQLAEKALGKTTNRTYRSGLVQKSHGEGRALEIIRSGLAAAGLSGNDLASLPGNDPLKVTLAQQVWAESTVTMAWIATKLQMRSAANVSQILRREKHRALARKPRRAR